MLFGSLVVTRLQVYMVFSFSLLKCWWDVFHIDVNAFINLFDDHSTISSV